MDELELMTEIGRVLEKFSAAHCLFSFTFLIEFRQTEGRSFN
jgi:hypothetical protein